MTILSRILRFLFWLLVLSWSVALLRRVFRYLLKSAGIPAASTGSGSTPGTVDASGGSGRLVRDPVCGMHLAESLALAERIGGELVHFCSPECREKYSRGEGATRAANG
jgi:YHS domain-containing protein